MGDCNMVGTVNRIFSWPGPIEIESAGITFPEAFSVNNVHSSFRLL